MRIPRATCTGAPRARTSSTRRWCCSSAMRRRSYSPRSSARAMPPPCSRSAMRKPSWPDAHGCSTPRRSHSGSRRPAGCRRSIARARTSARRARARRVLQFGGASGTLAAFGDRGMDVARAMASELEAQRARAALALEPRPHRHARVRARRRHGCDGEDRARHLAARADGGRRSVRAGRRRTRRFIDHAAEAKPGWLVGGARGVTASTGARRHRARRDAAGARARARRMAGGVGDDSRARCDSPLARRGTRPRCSPDSRSMRRECVPTSTSRAACHSPNPYRWRWPSTLESSMRIERLEPQRSAR